MDMAESGVACYEAPQSETSAVQGRAVAEYKECANCGVSDTPLWRKYNDHDLCNACGIYFRVNGFHRPFLPNMRKLLSSARKMGLACVNCGTKVTSMWRRTPEGESICNACGLYFRLNGIKRPVSMRKDWIRKRQRKAQQISGIMRLASEASVTSLVNSMGGGTGCAVESPVSAPESACFETNSAHLLPPNGSYHPPCESESTYKSVDYMQYYPSDYVAQFPAPAQMVTLHEPSTVPMPHEMCPGQQPHSHSIPYLHSLQTYVPAQNCADYMNFGDTKLQH